MVSLAAAYGWRSRRQVLAAHERLQESRERLVGALREITEREQTEEEKAGLFRAMFESAVQPMEAEIVLRGQELQWANEQLREIVQPALSCTHVSSGTIGRQGAGLSYHAGPGVQIGPAMGRCLDLQARSFLGL
jgi:hypothetical protein